MSFEDTTPLMRGRLNTPTKTAWNRALKTAEDKSPSERTKKQKKIVSYKSRLLKKQKLNFQPLATDLIKNLKKQMRGVRMRVRKQTLISESFVSNELDYYSRVYTILVNINDDDYDDFLYSVLCKKMKNGTGSVLPITLSYFENSMQMIAHVQKMFKLLTSLKQRDHLVRLLLSTTAKECDSAETNTDPRPLFDPEHLDQILREEKPTPNSTHLITTSHENSHKYVIAFKRQ